MQLNFKPEPLPKSIIDIEAHGVKWVVACDAVGEYLPKDALGFTQYHKLSVDGDKADWYEVYLQSSSFRNHCVCQAPTQELADDLAALLKRIINLT